MPEAFDYELNAYYRNEDAKVSRCEEIADNLTELFESNAVNGIGQLWQNGQYKGDFDLQGAIDYAQEHDDDDYWDVTEAGE